MNNNYVTAEVPRPSNPLTVNPMPEEKSPGIYMLTQETRYVLNEIMSMLDMFKREIKAYPIPLDEANKTYEPTCFKDEVTMINEMAHAIKGDLSRLMSEFN